MATTIIGTTTYNGHTYHIVTSDELGSTAEERWENAKIHCANLGGHLAIIDDANENAALFNYIQSLGINNAYFGLSDAASEGTWTWVDGTPLTYSNWGTGASNGDEPNGYTYENYGMFYGGSYTNGEWNDGDFVDSWTLNGGNVFICEVDNVAPDSIAPDPTPVNPSIEGGETPPFYIDPMTQVYYSLGIPTYDFVFLFDISGSMDSYITRVKEIVGNFAAQLQSSGITNYRFAVGEFGNLNEINAYQFSNGSYFTSDINEFTTAAALAADKASNGGGAEYGLTAIHDAIYGIGFNPWAQKRFIVLTDEGYQENDSATPAEGASNLETVLGELSATSIVVDVIGRTGLSEGGCQTEWEPVANFTGGKFYDINGDYNSIFRSIKNEVTGEDDLPIVGDENLSGRIMFAQWGYGFTPPEGNPLFVDTSLDTSADLAADFSSPTLDEISPANFAVTANDMTDQNLTAFNPKVAETILATSKSKF